LHTLLPRVLGRLARAPPHVTVFMQSGNSQQLYGAIRKDELDAAVCPHPDFALGKAMAWDLLREEPLVVLAPPAWAGRDSLELLRTEPLLGYDRSLGGGKQADRYLRGTFASPMPVSSNCVLLCNRSKGWNRRCACAMSKPTPLSRIRIIGPADGSGGPSTVIDGCSRLRLYSTALDSRLTKASWSSVGSPRTTGRDAVAHETVRFSA